MTKPLEAKMNLGEIRRKFIDISGRYDLVVDTSAYADNGANWYIQRGNMYLQLLTNSKPQQSRVFASMAIGAWYYTMALCRAVQEVWCSTATERWELEKHTTKELRAYYTEPMSSIEKGDPLYYCPSVSRKTPEVAGTTYFDSFGGTISTLAIAEQGYNAIIVFPPTAVAVELEIIGLFFQTELTTDLQTSEWSVRHPELLVWAALRELEVDYRNTEGVKDWDNAIMGKIRMLEFDQVEEETADINQIEG
jgi:hypothetical protein